MIEKCIFIFKFKILIFTEYYIININIPVKIFEKLWNKDHADHPCNCGRSFTPLQKYLHLDHDPSSRAYFQSGDNRLT